MREGLGPCFVADVCVSVPLPQSTLRLGTPSLTETQGSVGTLAFPRHVSLRWPFLGMDLLFVVVGPGYGILTVPLAGPRW